MKPINLFYKFQNVVLNAKESWLYNEARFRRHYLKYPIESPAKIRERQGISREELAWQMHTTIEKVMKLKTREWITRFGIFSITLTVLVAGSIFKLNMIARRSPLV